MSRLRRRTVTMSIATRPVVVPNSAACRATYATFALQISFLLGMQLTFGQEPPIHWPSTTAVRRPDRARCQASSLPPAPLPRMSASNRSSATMSSSRSKDASSPASLLPRRPPSSSPAAGPRPARMSPRPRNAAGPASTTFIVTLQRRRPAGTTRSPAPQPPPQEPSHHPPHFLHQPQLPHPPPPP